MENENADESTYIYPSPELRNYVKILRKIEREPAEAPQTSAAIRALERARRNRGKALLEESRAARQGTQQKETRSDAEQKKLKPKPPRATVKRNVLSTVSEAESNPERGKHRAKTASAFAEQLFNP